MAHYTEKLRKLDIQNTTLRDCFDPFSSEYNSSTIEEKIVTLEKVVASGLSLNNITKDYCKYYDSLSKPYVKDDLSLGLSMLIDELNQKFTNYTFAYSQEIYSIEILANILNSQLKNKNKMAIETKTILYNQLVEKRRNYKFEDLDLKNPSELSITNDNHLNAWAYWHGNLDADILLIGQDFGDCAYYLNNDGKDESENGTNYNLSSLFKEINIETGSSDDPNLNAKLYFTNAVLGAKSGGMSTAIKRGWYSETANSFIKPLIELIEPKVIISMGSIAYETICLIYGLTKKSMKDAVESNPIILENGIKIFVVYHCSSLGIANRDFNTQREDWQKIKAHI